MNWLYLIPVAGLVWLALSAPVEVGLAIAIVVGGGLGALWLTDKIRGK